MSYKDLIVRQKRKEIGNQELGNSKKKILSYKNLIVKTKKGI